MDNGFIVQSLIDSFEALKNNWELKCDSLINCIINMEKYDPQLSMQMWEVLLTDNEKKLCEINTAKKLVYGVMEGFHGIHIGSIACTDNQRYKIMSEHLFSHIANNNKIISQIFKNTYNCGSFHEYLFETAIGNNYIPLCMANIIVSSNPVPARTLIVSLGQNGYLIDTSIGKLFAKAINFVNLFTSDNFFSDSNYQVTTEVKEAMLSGLDTIENPESRAECTISILSL